MGGSVSAGKNNDELIDHLVEAEFIRTPLIQQVFRSVDRGDYYCPDQRENAYRDIAWRMGNLHLSAPCVYSEVMEALKLRPGLSFLNLGSGTGYLSTMAGLILGSYGVNHGIELYSEIVDFAYERLDEFINKSGAMDEYDFCEPSFVVGNCLMLDSNNQLYDRVYCGASCPEEYEPYIKNLVKIGGILIMPLNEKLLKITRTGESTWMTAKVLSVSFAPLITPPASDEPADPINLIKLGNINPPKLKHICRANIRCILKKNIDKDNPGLKNKQRRVEIKQRRQVRRIVIPIFDESDLSTHSQSNSEFEYDSDSPEFTISSRIPSRMSAFLEDFLRRHAEFQALSEAAESMVQTDSSDNEAKPDDSYDEKSPDSKIESGANELTTFSASFISMSKRNTAADELKNSTSTQKSADVSSSKPSKSPAKTSLGPATPPNFPSPSDSPMSQEIPGSPVSPDSPAAPKKMKVSGMNVSEIPSSSKASAPRASRSSATKRKIVCKRKRTSETLVKTRAKRQAATVVWKRIIHQDSDSDTEEESKTVVAKKEDEDTYTKHMVKRIANLPLPISLLRYLNYKRDNM